METVGITVSAGDLRCIEQLTVDYPGLFALYEASRTFLRGWIVKQGVEAAMSHCGEYHIASLANALLDSAPVRNAANIPDTHIGGGGEFDDFVTSLFAEPSDARVWILHLRERGFSVERAWFLQQRLEKLHFGVGAVSLELYCRQCLNIASAPALAELEAIRALQPASWSPRG